MRFEPNRIVAFAAGLLLYAVPGVVMGQTAPAAQGVQGVQSRSGQDASSAAMAAGVGSVTHLSGVLSVRRPDGSTRFLTTKSNVGEGDTLHTEQGSYARVKFVDGAEVVLRPSSQLKVDAYKFDERTPEQDSVILSMLKGGLRSVTGFIGKRNRDKFAMNATTATIGIRGTHFGMLLCQDDCGSIPTISGQPPANGLHVDVADGSVVIRNPAGQQVLNAGQFGYVRDARTPPIMVPPQQGIQVTMPPAISKNDAGGRSLGKDRNEDECTVR